MRDQPVSVAAVAALGYLVALGTSFREGRRARIAGAATALAGVVFGVYLLAAHLADDALCPWCLTTDFVLDALAVACLLRLAGNPYVGLRLRRDAAVLGRLYRR